MCNQTQTTLQVQCLLDSAGATELFIKLVISAKSPAVFHESLQLGISLLEGGNPLIQVYSPNVYLDKYLILVHSKTLYKARHNSLLTPHLLQRSFHERFMNQNSEQFFYTIHTKMAKAIVDIKNCHATATTDVSGQANTKNRVDDIQVSAVFLYLKFRIETILVVF